MNKNKHIHDEDYDFSIKLMVPLLTILVCTICLCATTWAWYTASVSTRVKSIVAGAKVKETVTYPNGTEESNEDGVYTLTNDSENSAIYIISFDSGEATDGYFAEITIEDIPEPENILNLFVNRVYAEDVTGGNFYYYIGKNNVSNQSDNYVLSITLKPGVSKLLKIKYTWAKNDNGNFVYSGNVPEITPINDNSLSIANSSSSHSLRDEENLDEIPTYKYSIRFIDNKTYEELKPEISEETIYETVLVDDYHIEGYEVLSNSYDEIDEEGIYLYIDTEKETNTFVVLYEKIPDSDGEQKANDESNTSIDTDATPLAIDNSSDETETSDTETPDIIDQNNSSEMPNTDETGQSDKNNAPSGDQFIESLLITDYVDEGTTETAPSSDETNSGTEEFTE